MDSPTKWAIERKRGSKFSSFIKSFRVSSLNRYGTNLKGQKIPDFKGYCSLYRYATISDKCQHVVSTFAAILSGCCIPLMAHNFGQLANALIMLQVIKSGFNASENYTTCYELNHAKVRDQKTPADIIRSAIIDFVISNVSVSLIYVLLHVIFFVCWSIPAEKQIAFWAKEYFKGLFKKDFKWFDIHGNHDYPAESVKDINRIRDGIGVQVPISVNLMSTFILCTICVIWKGYSSWLFLLIVAMIIPLRIFIPHLIASVSAKEIVTTERAVVPVVSLAEEVIRLIQSVIIFNGQHREIQRFKKEQMFSLQNYLSGTISISFLSGLSSLLTSMYLAVVCWQGINLIWNDRFCDDLHDSQTFDAELFFTAVLCVLFGTYNMSYIKTVKEACAIAEETGAKLAYVIDGYSIPDQFNNRGLSPSSVLGLLEFQEIRFSYPTKTNVLVLSNISFTVEPGWKAGFVGPAGSGLSTIFKLLLKNYLPDSGFIKLDSYDIRTMNYTWYLGQIGYVTHDPMLFNETIEENIRKGNPDRMDGPKGNKLVLYRNYFYSTEASRLDIEEACEQAEAHDSILELKDGYTTFVGIGGESLSPQLRLQIALARALIRKPTILILDEPTANLDMQSASNFQFILDKVCKNRTTLVIPNRLTTLVDADIIFMVHKGQIIEQGTYKELIGKREIFHQMVSKMEAIGRRSRKWEPVKKSSLLEYAETCRDKYPSPIGPRSIGFGTPPDIVSVKVIQARINNKFVTVAAREISQDDPPGFYETIYEKYYNSEDVSPSPPAAVESQESVTSTWESCERRDKRYLQHLNYDSNDEENNVFPCFSILRLTLSSPFCIVVGVACGLALGLSTPLYSYLFGLNIKALTNTNKNEALREGERTAKSCIALGGAVCVIKFLQKLTLGVAGKSCYLKIQRKLFTCILRQERTWFDKPQNNFSKLKLRLSRDVRTLKYIVNNFYGTVLPNIIRAGSCICLAAYLSPPLTVYSIYFPFLSIACAMSDGYLIQFFDTKRNHKMLEIPALTSELFNNRQALSALQLEHYFLNRLENIIERSYKSKSLRMAPYLRAVSFGISQGGGFILFPLFMLVAVQAIHYRNVELHTVLIIGYLFIFEMGKIGVELSILPYLKNGFMAAAKVLRIIKRHPKIFLDSGATAEDFKGDVVFRNVSFWFDPHPEFQILKGISFKAEAGKTVAIVGSAGSGKSICLHLILRLVDPKLGKVELDGTDTCKANCFHLRQQVSMLEPEPAIFERTVRENIAYGNNSGDVRLEDIIDAAKQANIHNFVSSLPRGYETLIGPSNILLTQGQRQRIALARIFLKDPRILLIEESSVSLDSDSDRKIQQSLNKARTGRTCIITAHRLKTVETADLVIVLHQGSVLEHGSHLELMSRHHGMYKQMFEMAQIHKKEYFDTAYVEKIHDKLLISPKCTICQTKSGYVASTETIMQKSLSEPNMSSREEEEEQTENSLSSRASIGYLDLAERIIDRWGHYFGN